MSAREVDLSCGSTLAVRGAQISFSRGEVVAITGQSGSGKSSLLYCLAGVLPVSRGEVRFEGQSLGRGGHSVVAVLGVGCGGRGARGIAVGGAAGEPRADSAGLIRGEGPGLLGRDVSVGSGSSMPVRPH
ncbi:ATP-binding cassette domain-containing protein [Streptomyces sp. NPDC006510]|uniref:ATP-binding cassette domain-containing protein n=1 Tax=Streptomyces sp. NPDC006510 TaxID=3155600 RepID=UPI0033B7135F